MCVCANNYGLLKLPPFLLPFDKRTCDGRKPGPQSGKKSLLLKPTGNLLKASQEALVHRRPPCLLNPPNLALPSFKHQTFLFIFELLLFPDLIPSTSQIHVSLCFCLHRSYAEEKTAKYWKIKSEHVKK